MEAVCCSLFVVLKFEPFERASEASDRTYPGAKSRENTRHCTMSPGGAAENLSLLRSFWVVVGNLHATNIALLRSFWVVVGTLHFYRYYAPTERKIL